MVPESDLKSNDFWYKNHRFHLIVSANSLKIQGESGYGGMSIYLNEYCIWVLTSNMNFMKLGAGMIWEDLINWLDFGSCNLIFKVKRYTTPFMCTQCCNAAQTSGQNLNKHYGIKHQLSLVNWLWISTKNALAGIAGADSNGYFVNQCFMNNISILLYLFQCLRINHSDIIWNVRGGWKFLC